MAIINITVQSLLNTALYDSYLVDNGTLVNELKAVIENETGCSVDWFDLVFNNQTLNGITSLVDYSIVEGSVLRTHNKIARLPTLEDRQKAKLDLASLDRAESDRPSTYDITQLPTQYSGNDIIDNSNSGGLVVGRPWA